MAWLDGTTGKRSASELEARLAANVLAPVASGCQPTSSAAAASGTYLGTNMRKNHKSPVSLSEVRLTWGNYYNNSGLEADSAVGDITISASVEYPSGTYIPVTFGGKLTTTINPGGLVESDPVPVSIPAATQFWTRTYQQIATTAIQFPILGPAVAANGEAALSETLANQDKTRSGTISGTGYGCPPQRIRARVPAGTLVIGTVGDSIITGAGDTVDTYRGYLGIATDGVCCVQKASITSNRAMNEVSAANRYRRWQLLDGVNVAIEENGINDLSNSRTLAQLQADTISVWSALVARGIKYVFRTTILPQTTSTDAWVTPGNQTVRAWESIRTGYNDWVRDGAPLTSVSVLTPVAVGTGGTTIRAGSTGHPLMGYLELANAVEVNAAGTLTQNGGRWRTDLGAASIDGTHPTVVLHTAIAAVITAALPTMQAAASYTGRAHA